ncbi:MAG: DUF4440 domain-containing protein, partial [Bacteroidota bacterium]|nr:DUF4440 domain-containing protein [Bacteroidota bacterium]
HPDTPIKLVLQQQEEAWNKGDLDGFMKHYWKSPELQFVSKNGVKKGWQSVYDSYQKNYAAKGEMGKLNFQVLSIQTIDKKNAIVTGTWKVENTSGVHQGYFTLWFKNIEGKWLIVMDHTS